jgi:hypothetical protein
MLYYKWKLDKPVGNYWVMYWSTDVQVGGYWMDWLGMRMAKEMGSGEREVLWYPSYSLESHHLSCCYELFGESLY